MDRVHILTQYVWPDAAPTGLYAEHLATRLQRAGHDVRLIGGKGGYRKLEREKPAVEIVHLEHREGRRGNLLQTLAEYRAVTRAFQNYIAHSVQADDLVIVSSAPPNTVGLAKAIQRRGGTAVYWLQDYYPELIRGLHEYPAPLRRSFRKFWDRQLERWDRVVKIGANLGGHESNSVVIRNWPTIEFPKQAEAESKTALYLGNLGYGHDIGLFIKGCETLRDEGYSLTIRADGPGVRQLPAWLKAQPVCKDVEESRKVLLQHEVHLVAAHPKITQAIFPSKIWNSIAAGRRLVCTGFAGKMQMELDATRSASFEQHLEEWVNLVAQPRPFSARLQMPRRAPVRHRTPQLEAAAL